MTEQLKPCPFCGDEAILENCIHGTLSNWHFWSVSCTAKSCDIHPCAGYFNSKQEAIEAWNRRELMMNKDFLDFILLVKKMRECQQRYFKTRDKAILIASKQLEASVDKFIAERNE